MNILYLYILSSWNKHRKLYYNTMKTKDIKFFFETLQDMYPENRTDLIRESPRQLLVAVVMSAQTTDKQVNKVTEKFFNVVKSPHDTLALTEEERYEYIKGVNYAPTKAKNLYKTAKMLVDISSSCFFSNVVSNAEQSGVEGFHQYIIPNKLSELIKLHGVGEKTAKVILHVLYNTDDIAVDTHVHRVANRIGFVTTKTPLQTSKLIDKAIPDKYKSIAHHTLIFFGRYHCTARKPKCETCPFTNFCQYYKEHYL